MNFRSKLALGFVVILAALMTAASWVSLRYIHNLSYTLRSIYADSVVPLRNAHQSDETFNQVQLDLVDAIIAREATRAHVLGHVDSDRAAFEKSLADYEEGATHEPAMQELLARYGVRDDINRRQRIALDDIKKSYPVLKEKMDSIILLLRAGKQDEAEAVYHTATPLFRLIDNETDALTALEAEQGGYLDKESRTDARSADRQIPVIAGAAIALGIFLVFVLARSVTEPLFRLTAAAMRISSGDLDQLVELESRDEVGQLALAFNSMTESLRTARTELEGRVEARTRELATANELLNAQMAERERTAQALQQAKDVAEAANRSKGEFLAKMSHEIRTPMNGVMGAIELTLKTEPRAEQREYLQMARTSADSLLQVINDILDFSKVESGKLQFEAIDFDLRSCLEDTLTTLSVRAEEKKLKLACKVSPEIPRTVVGDPGRLRQIVLNLVGNALKFTEQGGVTVIVRQEMRTSDEVNLHFAIQDTGIGIPPERSAHIFAPFEQADGSTTRKYGGTGLGLAISAQLVDIMGGTIWVDSELGKGSTFHFTARLGVSDTPKEIALPRRVVELHGLSVLVVDQDAENCRVLAETFSDWGMTALCLNSGGAGLHALKTGSQSSPAPFQVILLDCKTPDGFAMAEQIVPDPLLRVPIIMMVPSDNPPSAADGHLRVGSSLESCSSCLDQEKCHSLGVSSYLAKPVRQSELLDAIFQATGGSSKSGITVQTSADVPEHVRRLSILLTEDNLINQKIARRVLEEWGHMIEVAGNGREALTKLEHQSFDLVLMDIQMPEMDGLEATRAIRDREMDTGEHIPIIAITAHAMKGDRKRCLDAGMDGYISKPINTKELFDRINAVAGLSNVKRSAGTEQPVPDASFGPMTPAPSSDLSGNGNGHRNGHTAGNGNGNGSHAADSTDGNNGSACILVPLKKSDGTEIAFSDELLAAFADDTPRKLLELRKCARAGDTARVKEILHYLKGSAMYIGAQKMSGVCRTLESVLTSANHDTLDEAIRILELEAEKVYAEVKQLRQSNESCTGTLSRIA